MKCPVCQEFPEEEWVIYDSLWGYVCPEGHRWVYDYERNELGEVT